MNALQNDGAVLSALVRSPLGTSDAMELAALVRDTVASGVEREMLVLRLSALPTGLRRGHHRRLLEAVWAPLRYTFSGVWEVEPNWLEENLAAVRVLDVREPSEFDGPLGHIRGATLLPLGELAAKARDLPKDKPIVAVCRAGSRSAHATAILQKAGFTEFANLPGGMLRWRAEGRGVEGGSA